MKKLCICLLAASLMVLGGGSPSAYAGQGGTTINGDVNCSGDLDLSDAIFTLSYLFNGGDAPCPFAEQPGGGQRVEELEDVVDTQAAEIAALRAELAQARGELVDTQASLIESQATVIETMQQVSSLEEELEGTRRDLAVAEEAIELCQGGQANNCPEDLNVRVEELQNQLEACVNNLPVDCDRARPGADLRGLDFRGCWFELKAEPMEGVDLRNADLRNAILSNTYLSHSNLEGANLEGANLWDSWMGYAILRNANLQDAYMREVSLVGADLEDANLGGADLRNAYLTGANLEGADLMDADVQDADFRRSTGVNLEGTIGVPAFMPDDPW